MVAKIGDLLVAKYMSEFDITEGEHYRIIEVHGYEDSLVDFYDDDCDRRTRNILTMTDFDIIHSVRIKKGDRVICTNSTLSFKYKKGNVYDVLDVMSNGEYIFINAETGGQWWSDINNFRKIGDKIMETKTVERTKEVFNKELWYQAEKHHRDYEDMKNMMNEGLVDKSQGLTKGEMREQLKIRANNECFEEVTEMVEVEPTFRTYLPLAMFEFINKSRLACISDDEKDVIDELLKMAGNEELNLYLIEKGVEVNEDTNDVCEYLYYGDE
jgi:hypothetical protein